MTKEAQITMLREQVHDLVLERLTEIVTEEMKNNPELYSFVLSPGSYACFYDVNGWSCGYNDPVEIFLERYAKGVNIAVVLWQKDLFK